MKLGIIGMGKVGTALTAAFRSHGYEVAAASSREVENMQDVVNAADIVFLTVADRAIGQVAATIQWRADTAAVHCSGAMGVEVLSAAAAQGARVASFHPLQMFADVQTAVRNLAHVTIVLEGDASLLDRLEVLALQLQAIPIRLRINNRPLYHASVNYAGPFIIALLREASRLWSIFGLSEKQTLSALIPLVEGTQAAVKVLGLAGGMGGAVSRGDVQTIERHLEALRSTAADQYDLYRTLCERTIPLAQERGTLNPETASRLREILTNP